MNESETLTCSGNDYIYSITAIVDCDLTVKASGLYIYLRANSSSPAATGFIDPATGVAFTANDNAAGFYEALNTTQVSLDVEDGITIYGKFYEVITSSADKLMAYMS